ncbi:MAG: zeta toxin family protein [Bacteroidaceae bacterium]|nr:zeta toxin family protein [Bacteroidaceae bacterium]MBO4593809.1 zeta toxin family protein [Bacteroidaceae bacterium]MBR4782574.1 zeta toxin family protein [Bacteroidaceae bacterium]
MYIIAGCNGAGKTTASFTILPEFMQCDEYINADEIARGLSPFHPESVPIEAGRLMIQRIGDLMKKGVTFAVETTLSTHSYVNLIKRAHKAGYLVELIFLWLSSPDVAVKRVAKRVSEGGHHIPEDVIRRRYDAGIQNLIETYSQIVDRWILIDNNTTSVVVAETNHGETTVFDMDRYNKIISHA